MKTKKMLAIIAMLFIGLVFGCMKDNFKEIVKLCPQPLTVALLSNPNIGGTTTGDGIFPKDTIITISATPNAGYTFTNWTNKLDTGVVLSTSSTYTFVLITNITLVAKFTPVVIGNFAIILIANPIAGGTTNGAGSFTQNTSVTVSATPNVGYTFINWTEGGTTVSTNLIYTFVLNADKTLVANFLINSFTLNATAVNGSVSKNPNKLTYNYGDVVQLTAVPALGYKFDSWSGDASGILNPTNVTMDANKNVVANFILIPVIACPTIINLGLAGDYVILAESGISATGVVSVTGNVGINPMAATGITGFGLILPAGSTFSTSSLVVGNIYAPSYAAPTPANLVTATNDMHTAFTTGNGLVVPAPTTEFMAGNLNGQTLTKGIYKWSNGVSITNGITLDGGGDNCATFIFQIAQDLTVVNGAIITLANGAQAKNIFWIVSGSGAVLGTTVDFKGNILCKTLISLNTGAKITGRLLAQTAVTLSGGTAVKPE